MNQKFKLILQNKITENTSLSIEYANRPELWQDIKFEKKEYPKNSFLVAKGEVCDSIFLIIKGCVRCLVNDQDQDTTTWFAFENQPVMLPVSYCLQEPTCEMMQALEDTTVWVLERANLQAASQNSSMINSVVSKLMEATMARMVMRSSSLQSDFAEERYEDLITFQPDVIQRVPLRHIATYIGVKVETLSRIRRNFKQRQSAKENLSSN
jgi:CRP-like cAMP-binding protein